jgi:prophage antirepressor-like protein
MQPENERTLQLFKFDNVATGETISLSAFEKDGQAWFNAADVCSALSIKNNRDALARLDADEKGVATTDTLGGRQQVAVINESGLYSLIFSSRKDGAKRFRKWVTTTVIPSIRKHGGYINGTESLSNPEQSETIRRVHQEAQRVLTKHEEEKADRAEALRALRRLRPPSAYRSRDAARDN